MQHYLETTDFDREGLEKLIALSEDMIAQPRKYAKACEGKQLATLFYEPSTRTRLSFTSAMLSLGGSVIGFSDAQSSSVSKGESVADTTRIISEYADIIAMRHYKEGAAVAASMYSGIPVINAGDGAHAHPTQTLTDLLTIHRELGRLDELRIGVCGDLKYGRTVHSLIRAFSAFKSIEFVLISTPSLSLPPHLIEEMRTSSHVRFRVAASIDEAIGDLDVLYMTRVQRERFDDLGEYERVKDAFVLTPALMEKAPQKMIVLHPLPRVNEISGEVDNDQRAAYFRQAGNGKYIRMALIYQLLKNSNREDLRGAVPRLAEEWERGAEQCANEKCVSRSENLPHLWVKVGQRCCCAYCECEKK